MKSSTKKVFATSTAVLIIPAIVPLAKFMAIATPINHEITGAPSSGKSGFISPEALIASGGELYLTLDAKILPASNDSHYLQLVNSGGELLLTTDCAFAIGQLAPVPPSAKRVKPVCIK